MRGWSGAEQDSSESVNPSEATAFLQSATRFKKESEALRSEMRGWSGAEQDSSESVNPSEATAFLQSATRFKKESEALRQGIQHGEVAVGSAFWSGMYS